MLGEQNTYNVKLATKCNGTTGNTYVKNTILEVSPISLEWYKSDMNYWVQYRIGVQDISVCTISLQ